MKKYRESSLFLKSEEIYETLKIITDLIPEDNEHLKFTKQHILENIYTSQAKFPVLKQ